MSGELESRRIELWGFVVSARGHLNECPKSRFSQDEATFRAIRFDLKGLAGAKRNAAGSRMSVSSVINPDFLPFVQTHYCCCFFTDGKSESPFPDFELSTRKLSWSAIHP